MQFIKTTTMLTLTIMLTMGFGLTVTNEWGKTSLDIAMQHAEARRGGGGGFSSGRSSMSSFRSSRSTSKSSYRAPTKSYGGTKTKKQLFKPKALAKPKPKPQAFAKAGQRATAKQAATTRASSFKKPVTASARSTTLASTTPATTTRLRSVDRSSYYTNRNAAVSRWESNSRVSRDVIILGSPSYGVYDSSFMWHVAMSDPHWGYHNYNNPGYLAWKREARQLARENADLQKQLDEHDALMANATGDRNADYLPAGITNSDVMFAPAFVEATKPTLRICTGRNDGKYAQAGIEYGKVLGDADVKVVMTKGSVQNLEMLASNDCDAAFVQRDAYIGYDGDNPLTVTRVGALYNEAVHLFCSQDSGVTHLSDLNGRADLRIHVGDLGSGAAITWDNFAGINDDLKAVVINKSPTDAAFGAKSDCGIYVGYLNSPFMETVSRTKNLRMIDIESVPFGKVLDPQAKPVYSAYTIKEDTYKIQTGWNDSGMYTETPTVIVPVDIIVNDSWKASTVNSQRILEQVATTRSAVVSVL